MFLKTVKSYIYKPATFSVCMVNAEVGTFNSVIKTQ